MPERSEGEVGARVDINLAERESLTAVPGIGASLADRIVAGRPYAAVDDLRRVAGIGTSTLERLEPFLTATNPRSETSHDRAAVGRAELARLREASTGDGRGGDAFSAEHRGVSDERQAVYHEVPAGLQPAPEEVEGTQEEVVLPGDARNDGAT